MSAKKSSSPRHSAVVLRESLSRLNRSLRNALPPIGATPSQLGVLGYLFRHGELTPTELAQQAGVRLQTLTRLLALIEAEGWATRHADATDGRRQRLRLTTAGARLLTTYVHQREASLEASIASSLSADEQRTLLEACALMDRLSARLQAAPASTEADPS